MWNEWEWRVDKMYIYFYMNSLFIYYMFTLMVQLNNRFPVNCTIVMTYCTIHASSCNFFATFISLWTIYRFKRSFPCVQAKLIYIWTHICVIINGKSFYWTKKSIDQKSKTYLTWCRIKVVQTMIPGELGDMIK